MRVVLTGIDSAVKRLADGSTRTYYYAWRVTTHGAAVLASWARRERLNL
jgi:hypothetical protein